ncbi:unnamed protein product [Ectocarpus sp. CCAP 1310/34]|nr:unnamed protein product [Ectocarpus sp. CCAP 1310/34]
MPPESCKTSVPVASASQCRRTSADASSHRTPPVQYMSTRFPLTVRVFVHPLGQVAELTGLGV